jgi:hypothetical protein
MEWLDAHRAALRALIEQGYVGDRSLIECDIGLRRIDADIATLYLRELPRVLALGIDEREFCRGLGRGQSYQRMRLRIRLEGEWERFVQLRRAAGDCGRYGLDFAIELLHGKPEEAETIDIPTDSRSRESDGKPKRYWGTPAALLQLVECKIGPFNDLCPYPLPPGVDALALDRWPGPANYINPPFSRHDELHGRGLSVWPAKAVEQWTRFGTPCALWLPVSNSVNILLSAGAEVVPIGRVGYLDVETGESHSHPGATALFVLRNKRLHQRTGQEERANQLLAELRGR